MNDAPWPATAAVIAAELVFASFASIRAENVTGAAQRAGGVAVVAGFLAIRARAVSNASFEISRTPSLADIPKILIPEER